MRAIDKGLSMKKSIRYQIETGIIGTVEDTDNLLSILDTVPPYEPELLAFRRMALRWEFAVNPLPEYGTTLGWVEVTHN